MPQSIFVSYSSKDFSDADLIRDALETAGISCWIAPRNLTAGMQWGAGIVEAIEACDAVVVVFSQACNDSPQVAREMELAVANRKPLIPVRVADHMPTDDMKYFLGVSHWFNAFERPLPTYLPEIIASVKSVLARETSTWATVRRRLGQTNTTQIAVAVSAVLALALLLFAMARSNPMAGFKSPLVGRWEAQIGGPDGKTSKCQLDVQSMGQAVFSDACPLPLMGATGFLQAAKDGIWASDQFRPGDSGSYLFQGGSAHGYAAAFKRSLFGGLITRDAKLGEVHWHAASASHRLAAPGADVLPAKAEWPITNVPAMAGRAQTYARARWKPDAVLTAIDIKLLGASEGLSANLHTPQGEVEIRFSFYSPETQEGLSLTPGSTSGAMFPMGVIDHDRFNKLPVDFLDLPQAIAQLPAQGMRAKQIKEAQLENWAPGTTYGRAHLDGLAWMIDSQLDERFVVPAGVR